MTEIHWLELIILVILCGIIGFIYGYVYAEEQNKEEQE